MNRHKIKQLCEMRKEEINKYYQNNGKRLHIMVDKILLKLHFHDVDHEDFYSLANEIFIDVIERYDGERSFDGFLYSCLVNKFKSEMTKRNRLKRQADRESISIHSCVLDNDDGCTLEDIIPDNSVNIEKDYIEENREEFSDAMKLYLSRLSALQIEVLKLISVGYVASAIREELHITQKQYEDCYNAIHSYRNVAVLI